jgi:transcriptional regulator with XRE-family HTH domain
VDGAELGRRLRTRRAATGRTLASVAVDAGLSVPYIANLENGRGNPTLGALTSLARALGSRLDVSLSGPHEPAAPAPPAPEPVPPFARSARFTAEARRLAQASGLDELTVRERLLAAFTAVAAVTGHSLDDLDHHRILDTIVLINTPA